MSKTRCLLHIVFATKGRSKVISEDRKKELYAYIFGILRNKNCHLHRMNGVADHIHMLIDLNPSVALAELMKEIKVSSSKWLSHENRIFPFFEGWGAGYYGVSISPSDIEGCKNYIINQEVHHNGILLMDEMKKMAESNGLKWFPDDWA